MKTLIIIVIFSFSQLKAGAFSEDVFKSFSSGGISGKPLIFPTQGIALSGSITYFGNQLYESGGLASIGLIPDSIKRLSPLAYKKNSFFSSNKLKLIGCNENIEKFNQINLERKKQKNIKLEKKDQRLNIGCKFSESLK